MRNHRASSEGNAHVAPETSFLRSNRPASTAFNLDTLRVNLPPETSTSAENIQFGSTNELTASVPTSFTISPSSSASAHPIIDPAEISRLRASILAAGSRPSYRSTIDSERPSTTPISINRPSSDSDAASRSPFSDFLSRRRAVATTTSGSPRDYPATRTTFADIFETSNTAFSTPPASITVPVRPAPMFSAYATSVSGGSSSTRTEEAESNTSLGSADQSYSECSICMNSRVNAVIYRCGHMLVTAHMPHSNNRCDSVLPFLVLVLYNLSAQLKVFG
uniref:Uncharacterized protein n=1 Tax=Ditylenchus dipsaci TaxID=166011 RepID=A0A915D255_9BILA